MSFHQKACDLHCITCNKKLKTERRKGKRKGTFDIDDLIPTNSEAQEISKSPSVIKMWASVYGQEYQYDPKKPSKYICKGKCLKALRMMAKSGDTVTLPESYQIETISFERHCLSESDDGYSKISNVFFFLPEGVFGALSF